MLYYLSNTPEFIDKNITDFTELSTDSEFWLNMIKHNKKYEDIFLVNTRTLITKSEVRHVFRKVPGLVKKIDKNMLLSSKLSSKELLLLIRSITGKYQNKALFTNWDLSDELKEEFKLDLMSEVLSGKSKASTILKNCISSVLSTEQSKEDDNGEDNED